MNKTANRGAVGGVMGNTGLFNNPGYKSTNVQFRGQDKPVNPALGGNPNATNVEEEYISNL